jgi:hypothetical protein
MSPHYIIDLFFGGSGLAFLFFLSSLVLGVVCLYSFAVTATAIRTGDRLTKNNMELLSHLDTTLDRWDRAKGAYIEAIKHCGYDRRLTPEGAEYYVHSETGHTVYI